MRITRGLHTKKLRISFVLHSEDVETHSTMSDNSGLFDRLADEICDEAALLIRRIESELPERKEK